MVTLSSYERQGAPRLLRRLAEGSGIPTTFSSWLLDGTSMAQGFFKTRVYVYFAGAARNYSSAKPRSVILIMALTPRQKSIPRETQGRFSWLHICAAGDLEHVKMFCQQRLRWENFYKFRTTNGQFDECGPIHRAPVMLLVSN